MARPNTIRIQEKYDQAWDAHWRIVSEGAFGLAPENPTE